LSIDLITEVRRRLDVSGGELLVAIEIADAANDKGEGIFVGVARIADRSRQDPRTVQRQLKHLVEVGWLEVVRRGGGRLPDGTGIPTTYRVCAAWVKGDSLPGLPDFKPRHYLRDNDDNLSSFDGEKGDKQGGSTVTKTPDKGDTAVSGDPLTRIPKDAGARANPSGSRSAKDQEPPPYDHAARLAHWRRIACEWVIRECVLFEISSRITRFDELPTNVRAVMPDKINSAITWCVENERPPALMRLDTIETGLRERLSMELREFRPPSRADRAA
jgi:hypothetical protein